MMDDQFNDLIEPDQMVKYYCSPVELSSGFTPLMKYVLMARKYPEVIPIIESLGSSQINTQNTNCWTSNNHDRGYSGLREVAIEKLRRTALMLACGNIITLSNTLVVKMLLNSGVDVNLMNINSVTALTLISEYTYGRSINTIKLLIEFGADVNVNCGPHTLLSIVIYSPKTIKLLIEFGGDVNTKNMFNRILLMLLLINGDLKKYSDIIIQLLYISGETLLDRDVYNRSAYDYYVMQNDNILDEYYLQILKGNISPSNTKSARSG